jgi:hypothetical protein
LNRTKHEHKIVEDGSSKFDVNIISGTCINQAGLLADADINAVAVNAQFDAGAMTWCIDAEFWDFLTTRVLRALITKTPAITLIRLLWKAEQLLLDYDSGELQLCPSDHATASDYWFYESQKEKIEKLAAASAYAEKYEAHFKNATINVNNAKKTYWYTPSHCPTCGSRNRKDCVQYLCKGCCVSVRHEGGCKAHKYGPSATVVAGFTVTAALSVAATAGGAEAIGM